MLCVWVREQLPLARLRSSTRRTQRVILIFLIFKRENQEKILGVNRFSDKVGIGYTTWQQIFDSTDHWFCFSFFSEEKQKISASSAREKWTLIGSPL